MPKRIAPLSDMQVSKIKPQQKQRTLFDGGGLFLLVTPPGGKLWRLKYRFDGKEKMLALGAYPEISLADARQRREEARRQVAHGIDPGALRWLGRSRDAARRYRYLRGEQTMGELEGKVAVVLGASAEGGTRAGCGAEASGIGAERAADGGVGTRGTSASSGGRAAGDGHSVQTQPPRLCPRCGCVHPYFG